MGNMDKLMERARDELFSHINRCGVLQAAREDQRQWMDETIDYLGERYPDLSDPQLTELYNVGIRFCQPAIPHGDKHREDAIEAPAQAVEAPTPPESSKPAEAENTEAEKEDANAA